MSAHTSTRSSKCALPPPLSRVARRGLGGCSPLPPMYPGTCEPQDAAHTQGHEPCAHPEAQQEVGGLPQEVRRWGGGAAQKSKDTQGSSCVLCDCPLLQDPFHGSLPLPAAHLWARDKLPGPQFPANGANGRQSLPRGLAVASGGNAHKAFRAEPPPSFHLPSVPEIPAGWHSQSVPAAQPPPQPHTNHGVLSWSPRSLHACPLASKRAADANPLLGCPSAGLAKGITGPAGLEGDICWKYRRD